MTDLQFKEAVRAYVETLAPTVGPFKIVEFDFNATSDATQTALVLCWVGTADNAVTKNVYKVWYVGGVLTKALLAKTEWPAGI